MKSVALFMTTVLLLSVFASSFVIKSVGSESGLVGYWKFDDGSGTTATDSSGNNNTGTLYSDPAWVDGKYGKASSFDGVDDYVKVEDSNSLHFSTSVTLMAWVCLPLDATYSDSRVLGKDAWNGGTNLHLVIHDNLGHIGFGLGIGDGYTSVFQTSIEVVPRETWTHVAATYNGSLMRVYINGFLDSSLPWTSGLSSNTNPLTIGSKNPPYLGYFFNGTIDEVRIYDRALSQQEIQNDMRALVGYWKFDECSGNTTADSSGNGNTGALIDGPVWVDGKFGKALSFDGVDDYVRIEASSSLGVTSQVTVEAWVSAQAYVDSVGDNSHIVSRTDWNGGSIYTLNIYGGTHRVAYAVNQYPDQQPSESDLPLNTWTHIAMTYDGSRVQFYMNGQPDGSYALSGPIQVTTKWLAIGCDSYGSTWAHFNGIIDEVRIYNSALSQQEIQIDMTGARANRLTVCVMNSSSLPVNNASVKVANFTAYSNISGYASFDLPFGTYNVSASHPDYKPAWWIVDLDSDKNITLTLSYPYVFEGEIADSNIILAPVQSGYNITILNNLTSSDLDIFFDWKNMGTIPPGTWQVFIFDHLPNLVVEAASKGSSDYPKAWYKHPLPIQLTPTTGNEGAFPPEPIPYVAGSIFVIPYPPVYGQNTTIGVTLHNPYNHTLNISRVDFQMSGLTVGGYFTSVGYLSDISLQENETHVFSIYWNATASGHHCIRVVLTYSPTTQAMQRNIDIEDDVVQGGTGQVPFKLVNPFEASKEMTIKVKKQLPVGCQAELEINGHIYDTSSDIVIDVPAGQELNAVLRIETSSITLGDGVVDVEAYIDGQLIGGVRKTMQTIAPNPRISVHGPSGQPMGFEKEAILVEGVGWLPNSEVDLKMGLTYFGSVFANEQGKFAIPAGIPDLGPAPLLVSVSAESESQQAHLYSLFPLGFLYLGNAKAMTDLGDCLLKVLYAKVEVLGDTMTGAELIYKSLTSKEIPLDTFASAITKILLDISIGAYLKCGGVIINLVTGQYHHVDLLVETGNGTIGTTGQGVYINTVNASWASGNNFNDSQLIFIPFTTSFNITIDSTRAAYEVESYNMTVAFACGRVNKTTNLSLQGEIQRGTLATYEVSLENWTISATPLHNIRVASVASKSVVGQGYSIPINVSIANDGYYAETFNVTAYANQTLIETKAITLTSGNSTTTTFTWNSTGFAYGNYTIWAYAWPLRNETDISDNNCTGGWIIVTIPGDVVEPYFEVDIYDITAICICYDSKIGPPPDPLYYPNCDLDGNGIIDIYDVTAACVTYGQKYP